MAQGYSVGKATTAGGAEVHLTGRGAVSGVVIFTDGTNDATVLIADSSTEIITLYAAGADLMRVVPFPGDAAFTTNLTVTVTGTGAGAYTFFRPI